MEQNHSSVILAFSACTKQLSNLHWTFWRKNSLILLPQTLFIANSLQLNLNSRVYSLDEDLSLHEIYRYNLEDKNYTYTNLGKTNSTDFPENVKYIWERRSNLSTVHLNVLYINYIPYNMIEPPRKPEGYLAELFLILQERLQFKYNLKNCGDCWGEKLGDGNYTCMYGELQRGKGNWTIADCAETTELSLTFDFSMPLIFLPKKIVTRRPLEDLNGNAYMNVFNKTFWIVLIASTVVLSFFLHRILKMEQRKDTQRQSSFVDVVCFTILSLCCREINAMKANCAGKMLIIIILCWAFLISSAYNAILTSELSVPKVSPPIKSFEDLLESKDYHLVLRKIGSTYDYFKTAPEHSTGITLDLK